MMMAAVTMVTFVACGDDNKEDDEPITVKDSRITQVIPNQYLKELQKHMAIYDGVNPPNVEGVYLIAPALLHYDSYMPRVWTLSATPTLSSTLRTWPTRR